MKHGCLAITANVQGLLLCWYSVIRQPELLLSKVTKDENIFYSSSVLLQPELQPNSEQKDEDLFVSQHSSKPDVACCFSSGDEKQNMQTIKGLLKKVNLSYENAKQKEVVRLNETCQPRH